MVTKISLRKKFLEIYNTLVSDDLLTPSSFCMEMGCNCNSCPLRGSNYLLLFKGLYPEVDSFIGPNSCVGLLPYGKIKCDDEELLEELFHFIFEAVGKQSKISGSIELFKDSLEVNKPKNKRKLYTEYVLETPISMNDHVVTGFTGDWTITTDTGFMGDE